MKNAAFCRNSAKVASVIQRKKIFSSNLVHLPLRGVQKADSEAFVGYPRISGVSNFFKTLKAVYPGHTCRPW